jgi:hypothetical protein
MKRRWDDDVVFKNQARGTEDKGKKKEFVNVSLIPLFCVFLSASPSFCVSTPFSIYKTCLERGTREKICT